MSEIKARLLFRRGTAAQWAGANPVLLDGEPAWETDTGNLRIGDGVTAFLSLPIYSLDQVIAAVETTANSALSTANAALAKAANLSDVADADAAIANLGITASATELGHVKDVTGAIQTQLDAKVNKATAIFTGSIEEKIHTLSGTAVELTAANGTIQTHTLTGNTTYTEVLANGQSINLMIDDGAGFTVTWPAMSWVNNEKLPPVLASTGYTVVVLWKVGTTLYGALAGNGA